MSNSWEQRRQTLSHTTITAGMTPVSQTAPPVIAGTPAAAAGGRWNNARLWRWLAFAVLGGVVLVVLVQLALDGQVFGLKRRAPAPPEPTAWVRQPTIVSPPTPTFTPEPPPTPAPAPAPTPAPPTRAYKGVRGGVQTCWRNYVCPEGSRQ